MKQPYKTSLQQFLLVRNSLSPISLVQKHERLLLKLTIQSVKKHCRASSTTH